MKLRRVMIVLNGLGGDDLLLAQGLALCEAHKAKLDALFVRRNAASGGDFLGDAFSIYGMETVLEALDDAASEACIRAHEAFDTMADNASPDHIGRFIEYVGLPEDALADEGRLSDLIIVGKPEGADIHAPMNAVEMAAAQTGRPVLTVPQDSPAQDAFKKVTIAWDGSLEAMRAVIGAMPFLTIADSVSVIHAGTDDEATGQLSRFAHYLDIHGVKAAIRTIPLNNKGAANVLAAACKKDGADLLVMGGFGAAGWKHLIGWDETTVLIRDSDLAILLAH